MHYHSYLAQNSGLLRIVIPHFLPTMFQEHSEPPKFSLINPKSNLIEQVKGMISP